MRGTDHKQSPLFSYVNLEDRIPRDHPLRRVKVLADLVLRSMSAHFDALYAEGGRPSIAPERLLRASLLQCLFSIRSERALVEHIDFNMMYRWFVGLTLDEAIWDHSTFSANRERLLKESVMREFFGGVLAIAEWAELVSDEHFSVDGSLLRAWASHKSMAARDGSDEPPGPDQGRNAEVDFRGKKRSNATHVSRTDPESLLASKGGGVAFLSYTTHALAENRHGLIVDVRTTPATGTARTLGRAGDGQAQRQAGERGPQTHRGCGSGLRHGRIRGRPDGTGHRPACGRQDQGQCSAGVRQGHRRLRGQSASAEDDRGSLRLGEGHRHAAPFDGARPGQDSRACAAQFRRVQPDAIGQFVGVVIRWRSRAIRSAAWDRKQRLCSDGSAAELR